MSQIEWSEDFTKQLSDVGAESSHYVESASYCAFCGNQKSKIWLVLSISSGKIRVCEECALSIAKALNINR